MEKEVHEQYEYARKRIRQKKTNVMIFSKPSGNFDCRYNILLVVECIGNCTHQKYTSWLQ